MLTYDFENRGEFPLYELLYRGVKQDILSGSLRPHEKLPSKRSLAQHLKLSVVTVENAYSQLLLEGYAYSQEKKGYFVSPMTLPAKTPVQSEPAYPSEETAAFYGDFQTNSIRSEKFPFSTWARLLRAILSEGDQALLEASPYNGVLPLRQAIADHLNRFRGMRVSPRQIVIGSGTESLYSRITQLLGGSRVYGLEDPGYQKIARIYKSNGVDCRSIRLDGSGLSISELRNSGSDVVHISPAHHFPTGKVMPVGRRQELLQWAGEKAGRYIIEDDYDSEFRFSGRPLPTLQSTDVNEKVLYINTFSKTIAPSIRVSYLVLPHHLVERYRQQLSFYSCTVPSFEQYTLARFISMGHFEQHINRMRTYYKKQRDLMIQTLKNSPLKDQITILEEDAGLHFLLKINTLKSDHEIVKSAAEQGIRISCLSEYYSQKDATEAGTIILNYSGISPERIPEAVERLCNSMGVN